jgi:type VI protein secretion system component VasF
VNRDFLSPYTSNKELEQLSSKNARQRGARHVERVCKRRRRRRRKKKKMMTIMMLLLLLMMMMTMMSERS